MSDRDRLIELVDKAKKEYANDITEHTETDYIVETLLNEGVTVLPCKVGDKVAVRALCECVYTRTIFEECRNECPFEDDCPCEECDNGNERVFITTIDRIFNDGDGWKFEFRYLGVEASLNDLGVSFFIGDDAEQQAVEYEQALAERNRK